VKRVRLDNAREFTSHAFNDYCMSVGIVDSVSHVHIQNGLAESLIKRLQLIARPLIMRTKLPVSMWGHAILHVASLIRMRPSANHKYSPIQLAFGQEPDISHLRIFGCAVYVPIAPPQRTKIGPQRRLGIYVGYETSSIIRYIEPLTGDLFTARFADCHFDEAVFPELGGVKENQEKDVIWCEPSLVYLDPRTKQCETEVQKIMHLQEIANQLPDAFKDTKRVTKSHIPAANAPARVEIPDKQAGINIAQESQKRLKCRRPIGSKDKNPRNKRKVFGPIVTTPRDVKPVGCRWIFVQKRNEKNEVTRYKARLVAQGFSQRTGIDYEKTYSPVMDAITFRYLISLAVSKNLEMRLMDVVTAYLYGSIDSDIYMKILEGFKIPESLSSKPKEMYSIKLQRSLYGLKQSGRMWYNRLSNYLIGKGYKSNLICPCVFIKKITFGFVIIVVYVDDLNIIGTSKEINEVVMHLKEEFEMKDLGKTKYCLGLQINHMPNGILVHQSNYTEKVLKHLNMDKAKSLSTPMMGRSLNVDNDPFRPCEKDEGVLGPEVPYLSAIGALISQTGYVFLNRGIAISWHSQKQTLIATSSNHAEVIALHEASRECVWLRSMTQLIVTSCGINKEKSPTIIHEDNAACVAQMKEDYIKSDRTKHIPPRYFAYTQDLIKDNHIEMNYVQSSNNSADLFTKALPTLVFRKHVHAIGMWHVQKT
ncbi:retrovirus-related pol polyprotein from transposon TNT 1-94, partial [Tanacetum coccineum]